MTLLMFHRLVLLLPTRCESPNGTNAIHGVGGIQAMRKLQSERESCGNKIRVMNSNPATWANTFVALHHESSEHVSFVVARATVLVCASRTAMWRILCRRGCFYNTVNSLQVVHSVKS